MLLRDHFLFSHLNISTRILFYILYEIDLDLPVYFELFVLSVDIFRDDEDVFRLGEGLYPGGRYLADFRGFPSLEMS